MSVEDTIIPGMAAPDPLITRVGIAIAIPALIFYRHRGADGTESLTDLVHQTAMYYEDRLNGTGFRRVLVAGATQGPDGPAGAVQRRGVAGRAGLCQVRRQGHRAHRRGRGVVEVHGRRHGIKSNEQAGHDRRAARRTGQDRRARIASVAAGSTDDRSPTTPKSAMAKIGAFGSLFTATIVLLDCMPARCWIAPERPAAT